MKNTPEIKAKCIELRLSGKTAREIYEEYYVNAVYSPCDLSAFNIALSHWYTEWRLNKGGKFDGFTIHNATVQVDADGNLKQAWLKQHRDEIDYECLAEIVNKIEPVQVLVNKQQTRVAELLEIPLFDVHFGLNDFEYYSSTLNEIINIVSNKQREKIVLIIGQDLFHCDNFKSTTTKGTQLPTVNLERAFEDAIKFYSKIIQACVTFANSVDIHYSQGNHDETVSWFFFQALKERFSKNDTITFDADRRVRKCFTWNGNFVGYSHSDEGRTSAKDIRLQYTSEYPVEFAACKTREIHLGHTHTEFADQDVSGFVVRRLCTKNNTDEWHRTQGYVGNHKRFMLFEYVPDRLKSIQYVM